MTHLWVTAGFGLERRKNEGWRSSDACVDSCNPENHVCDGVLLLPLSWQDVDAGRTFGGRALVH